MRYRCLRECWWQGDRWHKGRVYDLDPALEPPHHFEPLESPQPAPQEVPSAPAGAKEQGAGDVEGRFVCPVCEKELTSERGLNSHLRQVHPGHDGDFDGALFPGEDEAS